MRLLVARLLYWLRGLFEDPVELSEAPGLGSGERHQANR
jgi:hypothetical protein